MADEVRGNGAGIPKNRKREVRETINAAFADDIFILVDPSKNTKIQLLKNSEEVAVQASSDSKLVDGTQITEANVIANKANILFSTVDANSTTDYYASDKGVTILKITPSGTPGSGTMNFNITQDDS